jgi:hypothetical protein
MKITCPKCGSSVPADRCNVATDVAVCARCNEAFAISALVAQGHVPDDFDIHDPPAGAWFEDTGSGWQLGATTRSPFAFFMVPFMCVWSGFSLGGLYGSQIAHGQFNLFISLFGIPFLFGTVLFGCLALMMVCGHVLVTSDYEGGRVFVGIGPIGWTRRFDWAAIHAVAELPANYHQPGGDGRAIALIGQKRILFGSMLSEPRRYYLVQCLRQLLADGKRIDIENLEHPCDSRYRPGPPDVW